MKRNFIVNMIHQLFGKTYCRLCVCVLVCDALLMSTVSLYSVYMTLTVTVTIALV